MSIVYMNFLWKSLTINNIYKYPNMNKPTKIKYLNTPISIPKSIEYRVQRLREIEYTETPIFVKKEEYDTLPQYIISKHNWVSVIHPFSHTSLITYIIV